MDLIQNEPTINTPTPTANPKVTKRNTVLHIIVGLVISMLLIAGGFLFYQAFYSTKPTDSNTDKTATSSATPSANQKDETADWKTLNAKTRESDAEVFEPTRTIEFSFKYPPNFKVINYEGVPIVTDENNYEAQITTTGAIEVFARLSSNAEKPKDITESTLGNKKAFRSIGSTGNIETVSYFVPSIFTVEGAEVQFGLFCRNIPKSGVDIEEICDLIASTFKFLD